MNDITRIMGQMEAGNALAAEQLLPLVYEELRRLAAQKLAHERSGMTLDATALVHEAYLRLVGNKTPQRWDDRKHFFAAAAEAMRRILIEKARHNKRLKHGGGLTRVSLGGRDVAGANPSEELLALDEALTKLAQEDSVAAELVKLRFYTGLSVEEAGTALGLSRANAYRQWTYARAWLHSALKGSDTSEA